MRIYQLSKVVLSVKNNPAKFLNGITANTLDKPQNAFVDFHGKIVATFDQVQGGPDEHLIVMEQAFLDSLMRHLERYIMLSKAVVKKTSTRVYFDLDGSYTRGAEEFLIPQQKGQLVLTKKDLPGSVTAEEFTLFRLKNNIPFHGIDYQNDFLLNVDEERSVSFIKGCFLGQEFLSKVHSRSKPSWKLVVKAEEDYNSEEKQKMTSKTRDPETGKTIGFVFTSNL